jgi:hypothetical protein
LQFGLRSLFHLCCIASAASIAASGVLEGKPQRILLPMFVLGTFYTTIVAYRLRNTIARFAWDVSKFVFYWFLATMYGVVLVAQLHSLSTKTWFPEQLIRGLALGLAPFALWAMYCLFTIYERAKREPEDDYC